MSDHNIVLPDTFADIETVICDGEVVWLTKPPGCECERDPEHIKRDAIANLLVTSPPTKARH